MSSSAALADPVPRYGTRRSRRRRRVFATVGPLFVFMLIAFNLPIVLMLGWSFSNPTPTLQHYAYLFEVPIYLKVLVNTLRIAAITVVACVLLGYPLAYWLRGLPPRRRLFVLALVVLPFWISILIRTYAWIVILGNAGLVNRALLDTGLVGAPVEFLYNELGVIVGTVNVLLPFFVLPLYAAMTRIDDRLIHAAQSLGAPKRLIFRRVFFPLTVPALAAGCILVFILTLGFYITPAVLGGGRVPMIANAIEMLINTLPRWELAAAISTLLLIAVVAFFLLSRWVRNRGAA
jgi:putative spermidine/putrescine transport system permease protein